MTLVIIRDDLLARVAEDLPTMLDYNMHAKDKSLYNTPPVFAIYMMRLVMKWLLDQGGLDAIGTRNAEKAKHALRRDRRDPAASTGPRAARQPLEHERDLPAALEDLEKQFVDGGEAARLDGLKGHRSVGGIRASIYNAFPKAGVEALVSFMKEFQRKNG